MWSLTNLRVNPEKFRFGFCSFQSPCVNTWSSYEGIFLFLILWYKGYDMEGSGKGCLNLLHL